VAWSPDGKNIASGSADKTIKVWNAQTGQCVSTLTGHKDRVNSVCFSPCARKIISGGGWATYYQGHGDFSIRMWDAETGTPIGSPLTADDSVNSVAFSPDGSKIAAAYRCKIQIFDVQTQAKLGSPLSGHSDW
jgi:WD40 repeat protein